MKPILILSIVWLFFASLLSASDLSRLVQSERDFSRLAGEKGIRSSFLEYLSEDSVVFHNGAVNGWKWYEGRPASPGILYWQPAAAELSAAGDLGYTTGPWEFRKGSMSDTPVAYGTFVSIWKKQADGSFKVAVDTGTSYPQPSRTVASLENSIIQPAAAGRVVKIRDIEQERKNLMQADRDFSTLCGSKGAPAAYAAKAIQAFRLVREGSQPATAPEQVREVLGKIQGKLTWNPVAADVATSGDLGYTYGESTLAGSAAETKGDYLRIWKRQPDGGWKAILDVINPRE